MSMNFFATEVDISQIWQWLFAVPGTSILEAYSRPDQPNRSFGLWDEIAGYLAAGGQSLAAWPTSVGGRPRQEKISFKPELQKESGGKGRTVLRSPAFINVISNNEQMGCLAGSRISFWSEKGVRQRSIYPDEFIDEVDWSAHRLITGQIERQIKKASPAKLHSCPIMPDAYAKLEAGEIKLWNWGTECSLPSEFIVLI
jgi:hypothetical protein